MLLITLNKWVADRLHVFICQFKLLITYLSDWLAHWVILFNFTIFSCFIKVWTTGSKLLNYCQRPSQNKVLSGTKISFIKLYYLSIHLSTCSLSLCSFLCFDLKDWVINRLLQNLKMKFSHWISCVEVRKQVKPGLKLTCYAGREGFAPKGMQSCHPCPCVLVPLSVPVCGHAPPNFFNSAKAMRTIQTVCLLRLCSPT